MSRLDPSKALAVLFPEIAAEWHPSANAPVTPSAVSAASQSSVWWLCETCGNEWRTSPSHRTRRGSGCPPCSTARRSQSASRPEAGFSLLDLHPVLAAEWHDTRNGWLQPADVKPGSSQRVWWSCRTCGHEWETSVNSRASTSSGCRRCWFVRKGVIRATPAHGQSLADLHPQVAAEWHPTRNSPLLPQHVKSASAKSIWWLCDFGHEWVTKPRDRLRGERCPDCSKEASAIKRRTPKPGKSLADLFPEVAAEWNELKNGDVSPQDVNPGSKTKRWWKCPTCSCEWKTDPDHRTRSNRGCPECGKVLISRSKSTPRVGESLGDINPRLAEEWHESKNGDLTPFNVKPRSSTKVWWRCLHGHEWRAQIAPRSVGIGCPKCSLVGVSEREIRLSYELLAVGIPVDHDYGPIPVEGRRPVRADIVVPAYMLIIEYDGSRYHQNSEANDLRQTRFLGDVGWTVVRVREEPLSSVVDHEIFVSPVLPIKAVTIKLLRLLLELGYDVQRNTEYVADPRQWGTEAADRAVYKARSLSLATELPNAALEWHPSRNGIIRPTGVHPRSMTTFWWLCQICGHEWRATAMTRSLGHGCARCGRRRGAKKQSVPKPGESLADLFPDVAKEWHPNHNDQLVPAAIKPFSGLKVWWKCSQCAHEWRAAVSSRSANHGCPRCANRTTAAKLSTPAAGQSFADKQPAAALEWHPELNDTLTPNDLKPFSNRTVWWLCSLGHEWTSPVSKRGAGGGGCRECKTNR